MQTKTVLFLLFNLYPIISFSCLIALAKTSGWGTLQSTQVPRLRSGLSLSENCDKVDRQEPVSREEKVGPDRPEHSRLLESWDALWQWEGIKGF